MAISMDSLSILIPKISTLKSNLSNMSSSLINGRSSLEIRLFFVRISPCVVDDVPDLLTLRHVRREIGHSLEINGCRMLASDIASTTLRRDRLDRESSEVTYVSTEKVRVTGGVEFEAYEKEEMILCGSIERMDSWGNGGLDNASSTGWSMECYMVASIACGSSVFFQPKFGVSSPSIEVYIAGCCSGVPVIMNKTIHVSPRKKSFRHGTLDAIPEDEEVGKGGNTSNGPVNPSNLQMADPKEEEEEACERGVAGTENEFYPEDMYMCEDGQLSWFNAGVRVGVGIGLGMCLGIGIGVGLLMHSYQSAARNFRRRFL